MKNLGARCGGWEGVLWLRGVQLALAVRSNRGDIDRRVIRAAEAALQKRKFDSAIDVLVGVGWLEPRRVDEWRQGRVDDLERVITANLGKISIAMRSLRQ